MTWLRFPRVLGVTVCLYLVAMAVLFGYLSTVSYRFVSNATATEGTVVALQVRRPAGSQRPPDLGRPNRPLAPEVRYQVAGRSYVYVAAHGRVHQRLVVGDRVTVLYDPDHPERARLQGEGRVMVPMITSGFATAAVVLGAVLYLTRPGLSRRDRASRRPAEDGEPLDLEGSEPEAVADERARSG